MLHSKNPPGYGGVKVGNRIVSIIAIVGVLMMSGCSALKDYTFNGVPIENLYAESGQITTDANVDPDESYCQTHPAACILGRGILLAVEGFQNDKSAVVTPPPAPR